MKHTIRFSFLIMICLAPAGCFFFRGDECDLVKGKTSLDSDIVRRCSQFFITDSGLFLLYLKFAPSDAYNPFAVDPYILYYDKDLTLKSSKWINSLKIISVKSDTIYVGERPENNYFKSKHLKFLDKDIEYLSTPSRTSNVYNKVIDTFQLDTLTMNVFVGYREYNDDIIGLRNKFFYQDSTIAYESKSAIYKLSDFVFHPNYPCGNRVNEVRYLHFTQKQTIDEKLVFGHPDILERFYADLCDYWNL